MRVTTGAEYGLIVALHLAKGRDRGALPATDPARCSPGTSCTIRPVRRELQHRIDELLDSVSLAGLLNEEVDVERLVTLR